MIPYSAVGVEEGDIPIYSLYDVIAYGEPDLYGIYQYLVRDSTEISAPMVVDPKFQHDRKGSLRPIHRYSKPKRFELLLKKFMGGSFSFIKSESIFFIVELEMDTNPDKVWNSIRKILKRNGWSKYYDHIPFILEKIGYGYKIEYTGNVIEKILDDFMIINLGFYKIKQERKYLFNFRYIALRLMERHGVKFGYFIPKLQTKRLLVEFDTMWDKLVVLLD